MSKGRNWNQGKGSAIHQAMQRGEAIPVYRPAHLDAQDGAHSSGTGQRSVTAEPGNRRPSGVDADTVRSRSYAPQACILELADALHRLRGACLVLWNDDSPANAELDAACGEADEALKHPAIAAFRAAQMKLL